MNYIQGNQNCIYLSIYLFMSFIFGEEGGKKKVKCNQLVLISLYHVVIKDIRYIRKRLSSGHKSPFTCRMSWKMISIKVDCTVLAVMITVYKSVLLSQLQETWVTFLFVSLLWYCNLALDLFFFPHTIATCLLHASIIDNKSLTYYHCNH